MANQTVEYFLNRYGSMKAKKLPWYTHWQLLSEYVLTKKQVFEQQATEGEFLNDKVFDSTAVSARQTMASAMLGALWPNGAKTFRLEAPYIFNLQKSETTEIKKWYAFVTKQVAGVMDDPEANLITALDEYMNDNATFGTAGIGVFETNDRAAPVIFRPYFVRDFCIEEGPNGFVEVVYMEREYTTIQLINEYGIKNVSQKVIEAYDKKQFDNKYKVLHAIEPRQYRDHTGTTAKDMPFISIHIEMGANKILRESGFKEQPIYINRFYKASGEIYGRSPAMAALPDILEANIFREATILATEKKLDPPMGMLEADILGNGYYDSSSGTLTVFSLSGRVSGATRPSQVMEPLFDPGDLQPVYLRITELRETIANHFFMDRLLDLNNETRMTLGEANIRNKLRGETLGTIYIRQMNELISKLISRTFNILLDKGLLGVIPGSDTDLELQAMGVDPGQIQYIPDQVLQLMAAGDQVYKIKFISPAARIMQSDELQGYIQTTEYALSVAAAAPEILDNFDWDEIAKEVADLTGVPSDKMKSIDQIQEIRAARQEQQMAMAQLEMERQQSETQRNMAQAMATAQNAQQVGGQAA